MSQDIENVKNTGRDKRHESDQQGGGGRAEALAKQTDAVKQSTHSTETREHRPLSDQTNLGNDRKSVSERIIENAQGLLQDAITSKTEKQRFYQDRTDDTMVGLERSARESFDGISGQARTADVTTKRAFDEKIQSNGGMLIFPEMQENQEAEKRGVKRSRDTDRTTEILTKEELDQERKNFQTNGIELIGYRQELEAPLGDLSKNLKWIQTESQALYTNKENIAADDFTQRFATLQEKIDIFSQEIRDSAESRQQAFENSREKYEKIQEYDNTYGFTGDKKGKNLFDQTESSFTEVEKMRGAYEHLEDNQKRIDTALEGTESPEETLERLTKTLEPEKREEKSISETKNDGSQPRRKKRKKN